MPRCGARYFRLRDVCNLSHAQIKTRIKEGFNLFQNEKSRENRTYPRRKSRGNDFSAVQIPTYEVHMNVTILSPSTEAVKPRRPAHFAG